METTHLLRAKAFGSGATLGIGKFDGFHLGHRAVVRRVLKRAAAGGRVPAVLTFRRFPAEFPLYGWEDRVRLLGAAGIAVCLWCDLEEIAHWEPGPFLDVLAGLRVRDAVVGAGFRFGARRAGTVALLGREGPPRGISVFSVPRVLRGGRAVSSTRIRALLGAGSAGEAAALLGRPYSFAGTVVAGKARGRLLRFPTANVRPLVPADVGAGVYAVWIVVGGRTLRGAANIGFSPTFGETEKRIEVHILDFAGDIYGETVRVALVRRLRGEARFDRVEDLVRRMERDAAAARAVLRDPPDPSAL